MGIIATLAKLTGAALKVKGAAPGKSAVAQADGLEGQSIEPEVYQAPGVFALPPDGTIGVHVPVGGSGRCVIVIACQNYQIEVDVGGAGGTSIYSTSADGQAVKAKIVLKPDGSVLHEAEGNEVHDAAEIHLNGDSKQLVTFSELETALNSFKTSIQSIVLTAITTHTHPGVTSGPSSTGPWAGSVTAPTIDISAAKTTTIKTGG